MENWKKFANTLEITKDIEETYFKIRQIFQSPSPRQLTQWINSNSKQTQAKELPYRAFSMLGNEDLTALQGKYEDAWPISKMQAGMLFHSNYGDKKNLYIDSCNFWLEVPIRHELLSAARVNSTITNS